MLCLVVPSVVLVLKVLLLLPCVDRTLTRIRQGWERTQPREEMGEIKATNLWTLTSEVIMGVNWAQGGDCHSLFRGKQTCKLWLNMLQIQMNWKKKIMHSHKWFKRILQKDIILWGINILKCLLQLSFEQTSSFFQFVCRMSNGSEKNKQSKDNFVHAQYECVFWSVSTAYSQLCNSQTKQEKKVV